MLNGGYTQKGYLCQFQEIIKYVYDWSNYKKGGNPYRFKLLIDFRTPPPPIEYTMMHPSGGYSPMHVTSLHYPTSPNSAYPSHLPPSTASPQYTTTLPHSHPAQPPPAYSPSPSTSGVDYSSGQLGGGVHYSPPISNNPLLHSPGKGVPPPLLSQYAAR